MWLIEGAVVLVLAGAVAALAQFVTGYSRGGCPVSFVVSVAGVLLTPLVLTELGWPPIFILPIVNQDVPIVWSAIFAFSLVATINFITRRRKF